MRVLTVLLLSLLTAMPAFAQSQNPMRIPEELHPPLAAVVRMATGLEADKQCVQLSPTDKQLYTDNMAEGLRLLYQRLLDSGLPAAKAERTLHQLLDEGENLARHNYPTCTNTAPDIIVKAMRDAECIKPYLAGQDTSCFDWAGNQ